MNNWPEDVISPAYAYTYDNQQRRHIFVVLKYHPTTRFNDLTVDDYYYDEENSKYFKVLERLENEIIIKFRDGIETTYTEEQYSNTIFKYWSWNIISHNNKHLFVSSDGMVTEWDEI